MLEQNGARMTTPHWLDDGYVSRWRIDQRMRGVELFCKVIRIIIVHNGRYDRYISIYIAEKEGFRIEVSLAFR